MQFEMNRENQQLMSFLTTKMHQFMPLLIKRSNYPILENIFM